MEEKKVLPEKREKVVSLWDGLCVILFALFGVLSRVPLAEGRTCGEALDALTHFACFAKLFSVLFIFFGMAVLADVTRLAVYFIHPRSRRVKTIFALCTSAPTTSTSFWG